MIHIRPHIRDDIKYRIKWLNNMNVICFAVNNPEKGTTLELQEQWFDKYEQDKNKKFFTIEYSNKPIGFMGLSKIDKNSGTCNLFILIGEDDFRGKGIGYDAMNYLINYAWKNLSLKCINLEVNKKNNQAINLYRKLGFIESWKDKIEIKMALIKKID